MTSVKFSTSLGGVGSSSTIPADVAQESRHKATSHPWDADVFEVRAGAPFKVTRRVMIDFLQYLPRAGSVDGRWSPWHASTTVPDVQAIWSRIVGAEHLSDTDARAAKEFSGWIEYLDLTEYLGLARKTAPVTSDDAICARMIVAKTAMFAAEEAWDAAVAARASGSSSAAKEQERLAWRHADTARLSLDLGKYGSHLHGCLLRDHYVVSAKHHAEWACGTLAADAVPECPWAASQLALSMEPGTCWRSPAYLEAASRKLSATCPEFAGTDLTVAMSHLGAPDVQPRSAPAEADRAFQAALRKNSQLFVAWRGRQISLSLDGFDRSDKSKLVEIAICLRHATRLQPASGSMQMFLGAILADLAELHCDHHTAAAMQYSAQALSAYQNARQLDPNFPPSLLDEKLANIATLLAELHIKRGAYDTAIVALAPTIEHGSDEQKEKAHLLRSSLYTLTNRQDLAELDGHAARALFPRRPKGQELVEQGEQELMDMAQFQDLTDATQPGILLRRLVEFHLTGVAERASA